MPKNKKIFAICFFALQLLIIAGLIVYSSLFAFFFEAFGKEYKMKAASYVYIVDGVCYFDLDVGYWYSEDKLYIIPDEQTGEYKLSDDYYSQDIAVDYINSRSRNHNVFPWEREYRLKNVSLEQSYYSFEEENTYITVKVFMGKCKVTAVECDGVPIEEYITLEDYLKTESLF
ncbi:MAG: hypothetical protein J1F24_03180 [Oscillospiraceae bacterium]|nr:hypothetical protein [Oscillospiraceae bacterium]